MLLVGFEPTIHFVHMNSERVLDIEERQDVTEDYFAFFD
jgi:hypothetical protein